MTSLSDILFPSQESNLANHNINRILGDLKRSSLSITNRLRSIQQDADFVEEVRRAFGSRSSSNNGTRPLVANERCGSWYIRPEVKGGSAYFKSTDGHTGQWKFSSRRLNMHLLPIIERFDGIIIVDSTRRGKKMPDALSKTIPIWCCVLNRVLFPDRTTHHDLYVPPNVVSASEKSQMLARIPEGVEALRQLKLDLDGLRAQISKPLRPAWVTQETDLSHYYYHQGEDDDDDQGVKIFDDFRPVICCTSSKRGTEGEMSGHTGYIQGAGDDTENWAHGLTPPVFWAHADELLATHEADLPDTIKRLVTTAAAATPGSGASPSQAPPPPPPPPTGMDGEPLPQQDLPPTVRRLTPYLYVSPLPVPSSVQEEEKASPSATSSSSSSSSPWCQISLLSTATAPETWVQSPTQLNVGLGKHKAASRNLRVALANICDFVTRYLQPQQPQQQQQQQQQQKRVLIACETGGRDLSIGVALALLCWCFADEDGQVPLVLLVAPQRDTNPTTTTTTTTTTTILSAPPVPTTSTGLVRTIHNGSANNNGSESKTALSASASASASASPSSSSSSPHLSPPSPISFNKTMIRVRLGRIMTAMPDANPSRATLQSVNSFLMDWQK